MKAITIFMSIFLVIGMFGSIRFLENEGYMGDELVLHANLDNRGSETAVEDARVRMIMLGEYDMIASSGSGRIGSGDVESRFITANSRGMKPGDYWVRIYAYGKDGERDIKHRLISIE